MSMRYRRPSRPSLLQTAQDLSVRCCYRLERCFAWWTEIWQAGDKGRLRRNMLAKRTTGQPSAEVLKRRRERQWQKWEKQNQQLEEQRQARKEAEWRAAKRERLLNTQRARTAELGACRQEAAARSASRGEQAGAEWAAQLKQMEETYAATRHIEKREVSDCAAHVETPREPIATARFLWVSSAFLRYSRVGG